MISALVLGLEEKKYVSNMFLRRSCFLDVEIMEAVDPGTRRIAAFYAIGCCC